MSRLVARQFRAAISSARSNKTLNIISELFKRHCVLLWLGTVEPLGERHSDVLTLDVLGSVPCKTVCGAQNKKKTAESPEGDGEAHRAHVSSVGLHAPRTD